MMVDADMARLAGPTGGRGSATSSIETGGRG